VGQTSLNAMHVALGDRTQLARGGDACPVELGTLSEWARDAISFMTCGNAGERADGIERLVTGLNLPGVGMRTQLS
jgi:hypothetical protein